MEIPPGIRLEMSYHLKTQYSIESGRSSFRISQAAALRNVPTLVDEWGGLRIANDGDTIVASVVVKMSDDSRDATFVRVRNVQESVIIDSNAMP
jgi:hypothetical protein